MFILIKDKLSKMKSTGKVIIMMLVLFLAGSSVINAQRGMRGMMADSVRMGRKGDNNMHMRHIAMYPPQRGYRMSPYMNRNPGYGFKDGFRADTVNYPGFGPRRHGLMRLETIPNLTDKQKKDITDLQLKHRTEMEKFREETAATVKSMRDTNMKKIMDLLSDEQKKYLEENSPGSPPVKK